MADQTTVHTISKTDLLQICDDQIAQTREVITQSEKLMALDLFPVDIEEIRVQLASLKAYRKMIEQREQDYFYSLSASPKPGREQDNNQEDGQ